MKTFKAISYVGAAFFILASPAPAQEQDGEALAQVCKEYGDTNMFREMCDANASAIVQEDLFAEVYNITLTVTQGGETVHTATYTAGAGDEFASEEITLADTGFVVDVEGTLRQINNEKTKAVSAFEIDLINTAQKQETLSSFLSEGSDATSAAMKIAMAQNLDRSYDNDRVYMELGSAREIYNTGPIGSTPGFEFELSVSPL